MQLIINIIILISWLLNNFVIDSKTDKIYPPPNFFALATLDSIYDGTMTKEEFILQKKLLLLTDKKNLEIRGFKMFCTTGGFTSELISINEYFTYEMEQKMSKIRPGSLCYFTDIIGVYNKVDTFALNNIVIKISIASKRKISKKIIYPTINKIYCGKSSKNQILAQTKICIENNSDSLKIISSNLLLPFFDGFSKDVQNFSDSISIEQKCCISQLKSNNSFIYNQIKAVIKNKDTIILPPIIILIK